MTITCNHCRHENPDNSGYCNQCGEKIPEDNRTPRPAGRGEVDTRLKEAVTDFEKDLDNAARIKLHEALENFEERATKWARFQLIAITTAVSAVLAFLAYVGYNTSDMYSMLNETRDKIKDADTAIDNQSRTLQEKMDNLKKETSGIEKRFSELTALSTATEAKMQALETLKGDLQKDFDRKVVAVQGDLKNQLQAIKKIERSRYQILVHRATGDDLNRRAQTVKALQVALRNTGFSVGSENLFNVTADRQEILYYSDSLDMQAKAKALQQALEKQFSPLPTRLEKSGNNDPFQMVVKLCSRGVSSGNICKEN